MDSIVIFRQRSYRFIGDAAASEVHASAGTVELAGVQDYPRAAHPYHQRSVPVPCA